jgi:hypothetical protein
MKYLIIVSFLGVFSLGSCRKNPMIATPQKDTSTITKKIQRTPDNNLADIQIKNADFKYFTSKAKLEFSDGSDNAKARPHIKIRKDSIILISVIVSVGIEGLKVLITKDSIHILDRDKKVYHRYDFKTLSQKYGFPLSYDLVQSFLIGEMPLKNFSKSNVVQDEPFYIIRQQQNFLNFDNYVNSQSLRLEKLKIKDAATQNTVDLLYSDFKAVKEQIFPHKNNVEIRYAGNKGTYNLKIEIEHKDIDLPEKPLEFPFRIPKNYTRE